MRNEFKNLSFALPIAIVGMGITGVEVLKLLLAAGVARDQILTFDQKPGADFQDAGLLLSQNPKTLCVSPGISLKTNWIQAAVDKGLRLTSELEIAFSFLSSEKVIAITGSVGKSTVTALLGEAVSCKDPDAFVGGNLGTPLASYVLRLISQNAKKAEFVVLELSSYQLENFKNLNAQIGILTYLSPNHLERYSSIQEYYDTKLAMFSKIKSLGIINNMGGEAASSFASLKSTFPTLRWILTDQKSLTLSVQPAIIGAHNRDNLSLAFAAASELQLPEISFERMLQFKGLNHRMENCGIHKDVLFINDSKATSMDSVLQAFYSVAEHENRKIHLLLGGRDKNLPWEQLQILKGKDHLCFHFFGEYGFRIKEKSHLIGDVSSSLLDCLTNLKSSLRRGDLVLLSPGGTSLDEFKNFEDRGDFFKSWILSKF